MVKDIFKRLYVLANEIPADKRDDFIKPLLLSVTKFCQTFPPLCCDATDMLLKLGRLWMTTGGVAGERMPKTASVSSNLFDPAITLENQLQLMSSLPLGDCIQLAFQVIVNTSLLRIAVKTL